MKKEKSGTTIKFGSEIPKELHKRLKMYCLINDRDIKDVITEAMQKYLAREAGK